MNPIASDLTSLIVSGTVLLAGLFAWYFVNRASVRATRQVQLLEALLEEQKKQNMLLHRIIDAQPRAETPEREAEQGEDFTRLIPER